MISETQAVKRAVAGRYRYGAWSAWNEITDGYRWDFPNYTALKRLRKRIAKKRRQPFRRKRRLRFKHSGKREVTGR